MSYGPLDGDPSRGGSAPERAWPEPELARE